MMPFARVLLIVVSVLFGSSSIVHAQTDFSCFPSCEGDIDARMMSSSSGTELQSLGGQPQGLLLFSRSATLDWGIFDADVEGFWDRLARTSSPARGRTAYRLYANPALATTPAGLVLVDELFSDDPGALDDDWYQKNIPHNPAAFNAARGEHVYLLWIEELDQSADRDNNFKVRVDGNVSFVPGLTFSIESLLTFQGRFKIYPNFPDRTETTYDGTWEFDLVVAKPVNERLTEFTIWDGDLDHGDGVVANDTDDPDTKKNKQKKNKNNNKKIMYD